MKGAIKMSRLIFIFASVLAVSADFNVVFLHTNDVHARVEQTNKYSANCSAGDAADDKCFGGVARRWTAIQEIRQNHSNVLLLDAGDEFQGTIWYTYYGGLESSYFMNRLGYDAMSVGNHEFDRGGLALETPFLKNVTFPVLACNVKDGGPSELGTYIKPHEIFDLAGEKIGIVGYITEDTKFLVDPAMVEDIDFDGVMSCVRESVQTLEGQGVNKIVALGHSGFQMSKEIAKIAGVDVVIDGHSNTFLYNGEPPSSEVPGGPYPVEISQTGGGKALVYQAYAYGKYLGMADVTFNDAGKVKSWTGNPLLLDKTFEQDPDVLQDVEIWREPLLEFTREVLGESYVELMGGKPYCRVGECNMGNMLADAAVYMQLRGPTPEGWSDVAIAMLNGGGIRVTVAAGPITLGGVLEILPFRNTLDKVWITGGTIKKMLEHSVTAFDPDNAAGRFLQMSGLRVVYNLDRPEGSRVHDVKVLCTACDVPEFVDINDVAEYAILTSSFLVNGGDEYKVLRDNILRKDTTETLIADVMSDYIKLRSPLITGLDGRISFITDAEISGSTRLSASVLLSLLVVLAGVLL